MTPSSCIDDNTVCPNQCTSSGEKPSTATSRRKFSGTKYRSVSIKHIQPIDSSCFCDLSQTNMCATLGSKLLATCPSDRRTGSGKISGSPPKSTTWQRPTHSGGGGSSRVAATKKPHQSQRSMYREAISVMAASSIGQFAGEAQPTEPTAPAGTRAAVPLPPGSGSSSATAGQSARDLVRRACLCNQPGLPARLRSGGRDSHLKCFAGRP
mmetsp:Transcript_139514/g.446395  ORF Transcript_139514/g.446395 Transcript_139514/m.446395 type:complete len:210 (-) Transcript_139514:62-691(-)